MALFRRAGEPQAQPAPVAEPTGSGKGAPTPSRKQAEALRRQRSVRTMSKKEARLEASRRNRVDRVRALTARDSTPEKALIRDFVDARFNVGEFVVPSLVVILAVSLLGATYRPLVAISTLVMYGFILLVLLDLTLMWNRFKKVLSTRLPGTPTRGLLMYGANRAIQLRRFRMPPPRVKRGDRI